MKQIDQKGFHARYRKHKWYTQSWIQFFYLWKSIQVLFISLVLKGTPFITFVSDIYFLIYKNPLDSSLIKLGKFFYKKILLTYLTMHKSWIKSKIIIWFFLWLFGWYKMKNMNFLINQDGFQNSFGFKILNFYNNGKINLDSIRLDKIYYLSF